MNEPASPAPNRSASCADDYDPASLSVAAARERIQGQLTPVALTESLSLRSALGRILATPIISPFNVPNHDNSAMDGYAFDSRAAASEGPTTLKCIGTAAAGSPFVGDVPRGHCVRIMTGAVMPSGCDSVVEQERVTVNDTMIAFPGPIQPGMNRRLAGEDLQAGQAALQAGRLITPADLGLMASLGQVEVKVFRKLRVAFFSTGDELTSLGQALEAGQVYDSNRYTLFGMLQRLGVDWLDLGVVPDDPTALEATLRQAATEADVILTSGGVSVGEADHMKALLKKLGQVVFWKIAMKPGRPLAYGKIGQAHYFGLPGNPVAVMVTFYQFVREALLILMGQTQPDPLPVLQAECTAELRKRPGRMEFQRGRLFVAEDGSWKVNPFRAQGSGILSSMSEANCFILLSEHQGNVSAGTTVPVQVFHGIV
jgi:molybdopterin molybdotransferase